MTPFQALAQAFAAVGYAVKWWVHGHAQDMPNDLSRSVRKQGISVRCTRCARSNEALEWYRVAIVEGRRYCARLNAPDNGWVKP